MRGPGGHSWISEFPGSRHRSMAMSCARRTPFTHHETLAREPALAPAPGTALRSRESRPRRIYPLDPEIGSVTDSESQSLSAGAVRCRLERPCRAEGALSMRAPEDVVGNKAVLNPDTDQWLRRALDGAVSPITRSLHASQPSPQHPGRPCGAVSRGPAGFIH